MTNKTRWAIVATPAIILACTPVLAEGLTLSGFGEFRADLTDTGTTSYIEELSLSGEYVSSVGAYAGFWLARLGPDDLPDRYELDLNAGWRGSRGPVSWDIGYWRYLYDDSAASSEVILALTWAALETLGLRVELESDLAGSAYAEVGADFTVSPGLILSLTVTENQGSADSAEAGFDWTHGGLHADGTITLFNDGTREIFAEFTNDLGNDFSLDGEFSHYTDGDYAEGFIGVTRALSDQWSVRLAYADSSETGAGEPKVRMAALWAADLTQ
jgi:hypothetical protein